MNKPNIVEVAKKNIVRCRKARAMSQQELAKRMKATQRVVAYYENEASNIPLTKLQDFAEALDVSIAALLDESYDRRPSVEQFDIRLIRKLKQIHSLPKRPRDALWHAINNALSTYPPKKQPHSDRDAEAPPP